VIASAIVDFGIFLVLAGLAAAIVMVSRVAKAVKATLPGMALEIGQVNRAVNHVGPNEPTMIEQVKEIRSLVRDMNDDMKTVHHRLDKLEGATVTQEPLF
jgi:hypothetical protein